mmetsp:Transcript_9116/g.20921  ORF Transcript_9116/g.20921 Transcript_9116/m.20921 type:complete len:240 (-) Transcript_9116:1024-1743(-)|eukprot:768590-Hanusia_phi.AAC.16
MRGKADIRITLMVVGSLGILSALIVLCLLNPPSRPNFLQTKQHPRETMLHILTPHERVLFRRMQKAQSARTEQHLLSRFTSSHVELSGRGRKIIPAFRGKMLADGVVEPSEITVEGSPSQQVNVPAGQSGEPQQENGTPQVEAVTSSESSTEEVPCLTPEECYQRSFVDDESSPSTIPTYDDDMPEMISAMQQQDKMILDQEEERQRRDKLGDKAPALKKVQCGEACWKKRAVWCCRED